MVFLVYAVIYAGWYRVKTVQVSLDALLKMEQDQWWRVD